LKVYSNLVLKPEAVIYDRPWAQVGRLQDECGQSYIRKVGKFALNGEGLAVVDFLTQLTEQPHPNLLKPINFVGSAGEVLVEDYPDLSEQGRLDAVGREIRSELADSRIGIGRIVDFMVQISDGVDFIHRNGFVHGDVRSPNVFVERKTGRLIPTLFDYSLLTKPFFLEQGLMIADPETPPEERVGQVMVDGRHDVYQLGWMLRELTHYEGGLQAWRPVAPLDRELEEIIGCATGPLDGRYSNGGEMRNNLLMVAEG
jgi:serine/threonine protein kinase